jgi:two-component system, chemotaxis family, chemotaxis protein CheY
MKPTDSETRPKVLIADDEIITREWLSVAMRRLNCEIIGSVADGAEAVAQYRQFRPDILVMDIEMPAKSGLEALREILAEFPQAFVIVVSGHSTFDNVRQAIDLGAKGFVVKPFNQSKLADLVHKYRVEHAPTHGHPQKS